MAASNTYYFRAKIVFLRHYNVLYVLYFSEVLRWFDSQKLIVMFSLMLRGQPFQGTCHFVY